MVALEGGIGPDHRRGIGQCLCGYQSGMEKRMIVISGWEGRVREDRCCAGGRKLRCCERDEDGGGGEGSEGGKVIPASSRRCRAIFSSGARGRDVLQP